MNDRASKDNKTLKIVGGAVLAGGLLMSAFLAGGLTAGGGPSAVAQVEPTATVKALVTATPRPDIKTPVVTMTVTAVVTEEPAPAVTENPGQLVTDPDPATPVPVVTEEPPAPVVTEAPPVVTEEPAPPVVTEEPAPPVVTEVPEVTEEPEPEDTEDLPVVNMAPYVVSISPDEGATGVRRDTKITIKFSEPMDKANAQAAFSVNKGNPGTFSWNEDATMMTFTPAADYAYGDTVAWNLSESATDLMGAPLEDADGFFKVMRQTTVTLKSQKSYDGHVKANFILINGQYLLQGFIPNHTASTIRVSLMSKGLVSFDLSGLPEDLIAIHNAQLKVYQSGHDAQAYGNTTGRLMVESLTYGSVDAGDYMSPPNLFCEGILCPLQGVTKKLYSSNAANGWKVTEVTSVLWADWEKRAERGERSQFRLSFEKAGYVDVGADFGSGNAGSPNVPELVITYTHP